MRTGITQTSIIRFRNITIFLCIVDESAGPLFHGLSEMQTQDTEKEKSDCL